MLLPKFLYTEYRCVPKSSVSYHHVSCWNSARSVFSGVFCCCSMFVCLLLLFHQMLQSIAHLAVSTEWVSSQTKTKVHLSLCHGPVCMIAPSHSTVIRAWADIAIETAGVFSPASRSSHRKRNDWDGRIFFLDEVWNQVAKTAKSNERVIPNPVANT